MAEWLTLSGACAQHGHRSESRHGSVCKDDDRAIGKSGRTKVVSMLLSVSFAIALALGWPKPEVRRTCGTALWALGHWMRALRKTLGHSVRASRIGYASWTTESWTSNQLDHVGRQIAGGKQCDALIYILNE